MNKNFKPLNIHKFRKPEASRTPDSEYWSKLSTPTLVKEFGAIDYLDFNSQDWETFAATCSVRVQLYHPITKTVTKSLSTFQETAYGGVFRGDGQMLAAGDERGCIRIFDTESKNMLRLLRDQDEKNACAVHRMNFSLCGKKIFSFGDDHSVRAWDLANGRCLWRFNEHQDYVRAGAINPTNENMIVSGGYDGKVVFYDARGTEIISTMDHGCAVESVLFLPSGGICLSAGGTEIRAWDIFQQRRLLTKLSHHHKTITCLRLASNGQRFLSGGLDRHLKIYDVTSFQAVHTLDFANPILSVAVSGEDRSLVVGTVDGIISIQNMDSIINEEYEQQQRFQRRMQKGRNRYFIGNNNLFDGVQAQSSSSSSPMQMRNDQKPQIDHQITYSTYRDNRLARYDHLLRTYAYSKCLTAVMSKQICLKQPEITVSVMQELIHRKGLHRALQGRALFSLVDIIAFIRRNLGDIRFTRVLINVITILLDVYEESVPAAMRLPSLSSKNDAKDDQRHRHYHHHHRHHNHHVERQQWKSDYVSRRRTTMIQSDDSQDSMEETDVTMEKDDDNANNSDGEKGSAATTMEKEKENLDDEHRRQVIEEGDKVMVKVNTSRVKIEPAVGKQLELLQESVERELERTYSLLEISGIIEMLLVASGINKDLKETRVNYKPSFPIPTNERTRERRLGIDVEEEWWPRNEQESGDMDE